MGLVSALLGGSPVEVILFAQVINGILLPIVAVFLIVAMNSDTLLGEYTNGTLTNVLGGIITVIVVWLGIRTLLTVARVL